MIKSENNLIWVDLEMTGLDVDCDLVIEVATVVTDSELTVLGEGPVLAIHQTDAQLAQMDEWNTTQHGRSGLLERVRQSQYDVAEAERLTLSFLAKFIPAGVSPMCGNSVCQDRRFMHRLMPDLEKYFHYRSLDVSTIKEIAKRWAPEKQHHAKKSNHLALDDIYDSIAELKFYREHLFSI